MKRLKLSRQRTTAAARGGPAGGGGDESRSARPGGVQAVMLMKEAKQLVRRSRQLHRQLRQLLDRHGPGPMIGKDAGKA